MNELCMMVQDSSPHDGSIQGMIGTIGFVVAYFCGVLFLGGLLLLVTALAPNITHRAGYCLRTRGFLSFLVGLGGTAVLFVGVLISQHAQPVGVVTLALLTVGWVLAVEASSEALGRKLAVLAGREGNRVSHLIWGWLTYILAGGIPIVGWFVILPYGFIAGLGATILGFFVREEV